MSHGTESPRPRRGSVALIATGALLLSASCASVENPPERATPQVEEYAVLAVGDSRTYAMKYPGQEGEMTVSVVGEENGFLVDDKRGAFRFTPEGLRDRDRYLIRAPVVAGTKWRAVVGPSTVEHYEILSVGEPCRSAAGSFADCLVVQGSIKKDPRVTLFIRWTWARGIGLAKLETEADFGNNQRVPQAIQSLKSYQLKGAPTTSTKQEEDAPASWESD